MDSMCKNCKNFFGSQDGLCSKCYRDLHAVSAAAAVASKVQQQEEEVKVVPERIIPKDRCLYCDRRLGPIKFSCKCGGFFCSKHRLPEEHQCDFDHKLAGQRKLSEENPQVIAPKFNRF